MAVAGQRLKIYTSKKPKKRGVAISKESRGIAIINGIPLPYNMNYVAEEDRNGVDVYMVRRNPTQRKIIIIRRR